MINAVEESIKCYYNSNISRLGRRVGEAGKQLEEVIIMLRFEE